PSLVAVMDALPGAIPVTTPVDAFTVATAALLDVHVTRRPGSTLPFTSRSVAVACVVPPTVIVAFPNATETVDTGSAVFTMANNALPVVPTTSLAPTTSV